MTTIKLHIPDDLADKVHCLTGNAETYIIDLLRTRMKELEKPQPLADEYRLAEAENAKIASDFSSVDSERWHDGY
jgi:hypothetical protein